jgi:hypothetical protein
MRALSLLLVLLTGCATTREAHDKRYAAASDALAALQAARFDDAEVQSAKLIAADAENATAHGVLAVSLYRKTLSALVDKAVGVVATLAASALLRGSFVDSGYIHHAVDETDASLAAVATHLEAASKDSYFALELCLACWEVDWNRNGEIDDNDRHLLEVEVDAQLQQLPEGDPRRRPTFRFDRADVHWLLALVSFQRAFGQVLRAYDLSDVGRLAGRGPSRAVLKLVDKQRVAQAKALVLAGLDQADRTRALVLEENDDEREWLPSPKQRQHPLPFPVDAALFETWAGVISDVRSLVNGQTGLSLTELARLDERDGTVKGFLDVGHLFNAPGDIVLDEQTTRRARRSNTSELEALARDVFGAALKDQMTPSVLPARLQRMKGEVDRGEDSFERKLRYLLWLN